MPPAPASRLLLRRFLMRRPNARQASTAAETASKAKDSASGAVSKASEGLTRVQSSGARSISGAASGVTEYLSSVGGRTGRLFTYVNDTIIPPTVYYARVGFELSRLVFQGQKMAPPSLADFSSYLQPFVNAARNPRSIMSSLGSATNGASPESVLSSIRNVNRQQLTSIGVVGAEILGFFTLGTMIGRMKLIGYHGEPHHES